MNYGFGANNRPLNIAVVGTGIAGMSAAWLLNKGHNVVVYEGGTHIGGHSNTVDVHLSTERVPVDTGFIVYNDRSYPNLTALFSHLGVQTKDSDMSFAASISDGALEYSGTDLNGLFAQRINLFRPRFWRMIYDLVRFYREAPHTLEDPTYTGMNLDEYLRRGGYSDGFISNHLLPMGAAIWSTSAGDMRNYPVRALVRFFASHGLLQFSNRPQWRTVAGGSREYVERLTAPYRDNILLQGVQAIQRFPQHVEIKDTLGKCASFDHVVIASHADEAFRLLDDPSEQELKLLGPWRYTRNRAILHLDPNFMPKRKSVWSSWNFIDRSKHVNSRELCVTYWMNRLQSLESPEQIFVTLNPTQKLAPGCILREFEYTHPYFDKEALASQQQLWSLQGVRRTWYCGSYFGFGFHEDALQSALAVAESLGGLPRPWVVPEKNDRICVRTTSKALAA